MSGDNLKDGVSVKELEHFAKNNRFKLFLCLSFLLSCFFSFVFFAAWNIVLAAIGGIVGVLTPLKVDSMARKIRAFCEKQESTTQLILGCAALIVAIFIPPVIFFSLGTAGGRYLEGLRSNFSEKK